MDNFQTPMDPEKEKLAEEAVRGIKKEFVVIGKHRLRGWRLLVAAGVVIGVFAGILYVANRSGEFVESEAAGAKAYLPNGELSDVQLADEIILSKYWDKKTVIPPGQPLLPYSEAMYGRADVRKLASLGTRLWNPNRKYTLRWIQRDGSAFNFSGPTSKEIVRGMFIYGGGYGVGLVAEPQKCGTASTLVAQLVFQNKNPDARTFGQEYVIKEATRQVLGQPCPAQ